MKNKGKNKIEEDPHPIEFYQYIRPGDQIWCENPSNTPKPIPNVDPYLIKTISKKDDKTRKVSFNDGTDCLYLKTLPIINGKNIDIEDMAAAADINEVELLFNLHNRLKSKKTFTNVGPTLLIVNPFTRIEGVYGEAQIDSYLKKHEMENPELRLKITNPHLYDLVLIAIRELLKPNCKDQALIISGESGAGKTEATKNSMHCITYYFKKNSNKIDSNDIPLETKILNCNPILESFGNAKTIKNDNSSRFGKYVKIKLNRNTNVIEGAEMKTYLLEKSRISELNEKERNYHVFYFLLNCDDEELLSSLFLNSNIKAYKYLYTGEQQVITVPTIKDKECFLELTECFKSTGFTDEDISTIFKVVAAVLLLGNVRIKIIDDNSIVENKDIFQNVCTLLSVDSNTLQTVLTRKPPMPGRKEYGGVYTQAQVKSYVDALAKELFNKLFLWIITKLNKKLDAKNNDNLKYIGLLDIFGFECFEKNSLEQLCINYTNEQLQQLYIKDIFENNKTEFRKEGLESKLYLLDASYKDNKDIIRLVKIFLTRIRDAKEDKQIYDIVCNLQKDIDKPPKSEKTFQKVKENKFKTNKIHQESFTVEHTAKDVLYSVVNFVEKNKDETKVGVVDCILASTNRIIQMIFTNTTNREDFEKAKEQIIQDRINVDNNKIKNRFLGMKFCMEMKSLKGELKTCEHHYIRCLKPNEEKKPLLFHPTLVFNQIQYLGILATIQVRKSGFPIINLYKNFYNNYKIILPKQEDPDLIKDFPSVIKQIILELVGEEKATQSEDECLFGYTKIYMKKGFSMLLETKKQEKLKLKIQSAKIIEVSVNYCKKKIKMQKILNSIDNLQKYFISNRVKIKLQKKKEKIKYIQAAYNSKKLKSIFDIMCNNITMIQNCIRILNTKKSMEKKQIIMKFLSLRFMLYSQRIKTKNRIKMRILTQNLIEKIKENIIYREKNALWQRVNPFFISLLTRKRFKSISDQANTLIKYSSLSNAFRVFQFKLFLHLTQIKKSHTIKIFSFASSIKFSNFYFQARLNIITIQKYLTRYFNKQHVINKINTIFFSENDKNIQSQNNHILNDIFPNWLGNKNRTNPTNSSNTSNYQQSKEAYENDANSSIYGRTEIDLIKERKNFTNSGYINSIAGKKNHNYPIKKIDKPIYKNCIFPKYSPQSEPNITIFARILDIDIISDDSENSDQPWSEQFMSVYRNSMENDDPIQIIKVGNCHSAAISSKGKVFTWGWNNQGQCCSNPTKSEINYLLPEITKDKNGNFPSLPVLNYQQSKIINTISGVSKVVIGDDCTFILNNKGVVMSYGDNYIGQLGFGNSFECKAGGIIKQFKNNVVDISSTENSNIIITKQGDLYIWYPSKNDSLIQPTKIFFDKRVVIDSISTGKNFAIILSKSGVCYGLGSNARGELALEDDAFRMTPEEITPLMRFNQRITQVRCGFKHVVCVSVNGNAYGWGNNSYGQLGVHNKDVKGINQIIIMNQQGKKEKFCQVAAGFRASFFMTDKREIYYAGIISEGKQAKKLMKFNLKEKSIEIGNELEFGVVRIMATYNRNFSVFYASIADVRSLGNKYNNRLKINEVLNTLAEKWISESVDGPFISHLSRFFTSSFMKVAKKENVGKVRKKY